VNRTRVIHFLVPVLTILFMLLVRPAIPAFGQAPTGGTFELVAGWYMPETDALGDDVTYGLRGGYRLTQAFGVEGSVTAFQPDLENTSIGIDFYFVDASFKWYPGAGGGKHELVLFGGPGWASVNVDLGGFFGSVSDDSVTAHVGLAGELSLSNSIYLRPDLRARWIEKSEDIDVETTLALGFRF
jgi:hypothetical protein